MELIRVHELSDDNEPEDTVTENLEFYRTHDTLTRIYNQGEAFRHIRKRLIENPKKRYLLISSSQLRPSRAPSAEKVSCDSPAEPDTLLTVSQWGVAAWMVSLP